eukprot:scaffold293_cov121-Isochrysis_galbana.AAC.1
MREQLVERGARPGEEERKRGMLAYTSFYTLLRSYGRTSRNTETPHHTQIRNALWVPLGFRNMVPNTKSHAWRGEGGGDDGRGDEESIRWAIGIL